jgi:hypothetical protein
MAVPLVGNILLIYFLKLAIFVGAAAGPRQYQR